MQTGAQDFKRDFSKESLQKHRKTGENPAPLLQGLPSTHSKEEVERSHSHVNDGELGFAWQLHFL